MFTDGYLMLLNIFNCSFPVKMKGKQSLCGVSPELEDRVGSVEVQLKLCLEGGNVC